MKPLIEPLAGDVFAVHWPVDVSEADMEAHFDEVRDIVRARRAAFVVDMSHVGLPSASLRRRGAERMQKLYAEYGHNIAGVAHVVPSRVTRGILTAVYWLAPPPFPTLMTGNMGEAVGFAGRRVSSEGIAVGAE